MASSKPLNPFLTHLNRFDMMDLQKLFDEFNSFILKFIFQKFGALLYAE